MGGTMPAYNRSNGLSVGEAFRPEAPVDFEVDGLTNAGFWTGLQVRGMGEPGRPMPAESPTSGPAASPVVGVGSSVGFTTTGGAHEASFFAGAFAGQFDGAALGLAGPFPNYLTEEPAISITTSDFTAILGGYTVAFAPPIGPDYAARGAFVSYSFMTAPAPTSVFEPAPAGAATFLAFTEAERELARQALAAWGDICGVVFFEVPPGAGADVNFARYDLPTALNMNAAGVFTGGGWIGDWTSFIFIDDDIAVSSDLGRILLHEVGHLLGLKHPHEGEIQLDPAVNDLAHTVMSYNLSGWTGGLGTFDVQAAQFMYGDAGSDGSQISAWSWNAATNTLTQTGDGTAEIIRGMNGAADVILGGGGHDEIAGYSGNDNLSGGDGDDKLYGGTGLDIIAGGAGNDTIEGGDGANEIAGGGGNDLAYGGAENDVIQGDDGNDVLISFEGNDTVRGGAGADLLGGNAGNDSLYGDGEDDGLYGHEGDDLLGGGSGNDTLDGGDGIDKADYRDTTSAVTVSLAIVGFQDTLGAGYDVLTDIEQVLGSAHNDALTGDSDANTLDGKAGNDTLIGGSGGDILIGGVGADALDGGLGLDYASFVNATAGVTVNLTTGSHSGEALGDTFSNMERFRLSSHADTFTGDANTNYAYGAEGNDTLNGAGGIDRLYGQADNDTLNGDAGNDILLGGAGADIHNGGADRDTASYEQSTVAITINLTTGVHTGDATGDTWNSVEILWLTAYNDTFTGGANADEVRGAAGVDTMNGAAGNDILRGEAGNDILNGQDNDDFLHGGVGADQLNGGNGVDTAVYLLATGAVTINLTTGTHAGEAAGDSFTSIERFQLSNGFTFADSFTGSAGNDWVAGYKGNDTLNGMDGDDTLNGGEHHDTLNGGNGADKLIAGIGNDTLTGGTGSDQFHFNVGLFGADTITDFENGVDFIRITGQAGIDNISDLTITQNGAHVLITLPDGSTITVQNTLTSAIDASDFLWI